MSLFSTLGLSKAVKKLYYSSPGLQYAVAHRDNFSWAGFMGEVALSTATVVFTFGTTYFGGYLTSSTAMELCLARGSVDLAALERIKRYTQLASTVVGALAETGTTSIKKVEKKGICFIIQSPN